MTRFARARGSKASNEKAPEDGTPWEVMKEQLLQAKKEADEAKNRQEAENQRIENYENFLKEHKVQKRTATWCDFPEAQQQQTNDKSQIQAGGQPSKKKKKNKQTVESASTDNTNELYQNVANDETQVIPEKKSKKKKNKNKHQTETSVDAQPENVDTNPSQDEPAKKKKKNKKGKQIESTNNHSENGPNSDIVPETDNKKQNNHPLKHNNFQPQKKNDKKLFNGKPVRRKEIDDNSFQLIINGKEVELVRFDGFPIMKKDAERLADLKNNMLKKGIPKSEVQRTMKLERRRAEKALARLKREVCYNCRKGGHNLSDCPELKSVIPGANVLDGICFKCGSTEHRQFECKVQRDKEFRFATCFICKEPGHIARQCPDNPKGLYPNGGCCKLCGDVTHLRKDCPTANEKKEETSVKLQTLDSTEQIEDIGQKVKTAVIETVKKPKKIKF